MLALNHLSSQEMIALTDAWTGGDRPAFLSIPVVAPLLSALETAHEGLVKAAAAATPPAGTEDVSAEELHLDQREDHVVRAIFDGLTMQSEIALAYEPADVDRSNAMLAALKRLLPKGMATVHESYESEAGASAQAKKEVDGDPALKALLASAPVTTTRTMVDVVYGWADMGVELRALEAKKAGIKSVPKDPGVGTRELKARNVWITKVRKVLDVLDEAPAGKAVSALRDPVVVTATNARERYLAARKKKADAAKPTPPPATPAAPAT